jgi:hypothetical protein
MDRIRNRVMLMKGIGDLVSRPAGERFRHIADARCQRLEEVHTIRCDSPLAFKRASSS